MEYFLGTVKNISVSPILYIHGDAGIKSGNLVYDRSVHIIGNVERGVLVSCVGDLQVDGFVESDAIRVGGSLRVGQGINAASKKFSSESIEGILYVKNDVSSVYLDNTNVIIGGNALVENSIHASHLIVHGNLDMSPKRSVIVGGELTVYGSITTNRIGNINGMKTKIVLGIHHINDHFAKFYTREMEKVQREYDDLHKKMLEYKRYASKPESLSPMMQQKIHIAHKDYRRKLKILQNLKVSQDKYRKERYNPKKLSLTVRDTIFPGVEIYYRSYKKSITSAISAVVFQFSADEAAPKLTSYRSSGKTVDSLP